MPRLTGTALHLLPQTIPRPTHGPEVHYRRELTATQWGTPLAPQAKPASDFPVASMEPADNTMHPALPKMLPAPLDFSAQCLPGAQPKEEENSSSPGVEISDKVPTWTMSQSIPRTCSPFAKW